jgi:AcrR family transcriptional regulator
MRKGGSIRMNRSESKYFNTARLMDQALLKLLGEKDMEYISVKEICERAGVNRSTFYLHYETIGDLIEETLEYITEKFYDAFQQNPSDFVGQIADSPLKELVLIKKNYLEPYLKFVYENRGVVKAAIRNPNSMKSFHRYFRMQEYIFKPIMERFQIPKEMQNYYTSYYIKGIWGIIEEWLNRGCIETVEQIGGIIINCVRPEEGLQNKRFGE